MLLPAKDLAKIADNNQWSKEKLRDFWCKHIHPEAMKAAKRGEYEVVIDLLLLRKVDIPSFHSLQEFCKPYGYHMTKPHLLKTHMSYTWIISFKSQNKGKDEE